MPSKEVSGHGSKMSVFLAVCGDNEMMKPKKYRQPQNLAP
jgi:hypothetical protein